MAKARKNLQARKRRNHRLDIHEKIAQQQTALAKQVAHDMEIAEELIERTRAKRDQKSTRRAVRKKEKAK